MATIHKKWAYLMQFFCIIKVICADQIQGQERDFNQHCSSDELNHSILVECGSDLACNGTASDSGPTRPLSDEVLQVSSTRDGKRFVATAYKRMLYIEDDMERSLNINTTMYVDTTKVSSREVVGFGTTLDINEMLSQINFGVINENYGRMLSDLIGLKQHGIGYTIFRLNMSRDSMSFTDLTMILHHIETFAEAATSGQGSKETMRIDIILGLEDYSTREDIENLKVVSETVNSSMILNAYAFVLTENHFETQDDFIYQLKELFPGVNILASVGAERAPRALDHLVSIKANVDGLLIESKAAIPYDIYDYLVTRKEGLQLIVTSRPRPLVKIHGDWQNAQTYATEILNHLKSGVNGFVESQYPIVDVMKSPSSEDCAIYSVRKSNQVHFRGPIFYAAGHFSRYLGKGSFPLNVDVFTSPNMFAAKYSAFLTADGYVVAVVLNDNEHLLPFRLAVNNKIEVYTTLDLKSFNTFVLKHDRLT